MATTNRSLNYRITALKVLVFRVANTDNVREKKICALMATDVVHGEVENGEVL